MTYAELAVKRDRYVANLWYAQLAGFIAIIASFFLSAIDNETEVFTGLSLVLVLLSFGFASVVVLGIIRKTIEERREADMVNKVNGFFRDFSVLLPGQDLIATELDQSTIDLFFRRLDQMYHSSQYSIDESADNGQLKVAKLGPKALVSETF